MDSLEERHSIQLDQRRKQLLAWSRGKRLKKVRKPAYGSDLWETGLTFSHGKKSWFQAPSPRLRLTALIGKLIEKGKRLWHRLYLYVFVMTSMWMDDSKVRGLEEIVGHPRLPLCCSICQTKVNRHCCQALEKPKNYYMYVYMDGCICCMTKFLNASSLTCALTHSSLYRYTLLIKNLGSLASTSNIIELSHLFIERTHLQMESIFNRLQNQQTLLFSLTGTIIRFI